MPLDPFYQDPTFTPPLETEVPSRRRLEQEEPGPKVGSFEGLPERVQAPLRSTQRHTEPPYRRPWAKPHAFALAHGEGGASIWFGQLLVSVTKIFFMEVEFPDVGSGVVVNSFAGQSEIPTVTPVVPENLEEDHLLQTHLGWYGDVYLYWEVDETGAVTLCDVRGPAAPTEDPIGALDSSLTRDPETGKYFVKLGTVDENSPVDQLISSDVTWAVTIAYPSGGGGVSGEL